MIDYVLRPIAHALISPLVQSLLLGLLAWLLWRRNDKRTAAKWVAGMAVFWGLVWSQSIASLVLLNTLEQQYPAVKADSMQWRQSQAIAVLGCTAYPDVTLPEISQWPRCSMQRLLQAALMYQHHRTPIIVTGGMILESPNSYAEHARTLLLHLGVDEEDIHVIGQGENTHQEARAIYAGGWRNIALVTSASHMPRAVNYFRHYGINVIPVPVDHSGPSGIRWKVHVPSARQLDNAAKAFREYVGLAYQAIELSVSDKPD
ncbi:YdcF family protein [Alteromonas sp. CYL-A6]|uniref:YdcF family protein n=1 Tax=Alteromonas nitratireducens TaxID=3390813 RepID=UPI0034AC4FC1